MARSTAWSIFCASPPVFCALTEHLGGHRVEFLRQRVGARKGAHLLVHRGALRVLRELGGARVGVEQDLERLVERVLRGRIERLPGGRAGAREEGQGHHQPEAKRDHSQR